MTKHPFAADPYRDPQVEDWYPSDNAARNSFYLQYGLRDLRILQRLRATCPTDIERTVLLRYVCLELHNLKDVADRFIQIVKDGRELPDHANDVSSYLKAKKAFQVAYKLVEDDLKKARDKFIAHRDEDIGPEELRTMVVALEGGKLTEAVNALESLIAEILKLPVGTFIRYHPDGVVSFMLPLRFSTSIPCDSEASVGDEEDPDNQDPSTS